MSDESSPIQTNSGPASAPVFRAAEPAESEAIHAILRESNLSIRLPASRERVTHAVIGEIHAYVCEQNGEVVGVLQWRDLGEEIEILDLAVVKSRRRQGYGGFLLHNFLRQAANTAAPQIFLEVRESNAPAIALYKKFGFSASGRRPNYYQHPNEAALLLQLQLKR